jgi:hypothetical protein
MFMSKDFARLRTAYYRKPQVGNTSSSVLAEIYEWGFWLVIILVVLCLFQSIASFVPTGILPQHQEPNSLVSNPTPNWKEQIETKVKHFIGSSPKTAEAVERFDDNLKKDVEKLQSSLPKNRSKKKGETEDPTD